MEETRHAGSVRRVVGTPGSLFMFNCAKCGDALAEPGGLAFSPPAGSLENHSTVEKFHICSPCWGYFLRWLYRKGEPVFPLPPVYAPNPSPFPKITYPNSPYEINCAGVPSGGSLTPR